MRTEADADDVDVHALAVKLWECLNLKLNNYSVRNIQCSEIDFIAFKFSYKILIQWNGETFSIFSHHYHKKVRWFPF